MWKVIDYLNDPYLVVYVQNYFGVRSSKDLKHLRTNKSSSERNVNKSNQNANGLHQENKKHSSDIFKNVDNHLSDSLLNGSKNVIDEPFSSESETEIKDYVVTNWFWYYLFVFGTLLGDEVFYASFIPFWFWNIDGAVGRRIVMVWAIVMYIGQGIKDLVCWPRPSSPPVYKLQKKWALEYGMPSTHAMVGVSIPFSVILYTMNRYQYSIAGGLVIAVSWCTLVSLSRIYLGMHSVLDIVAGLVLALVLMIPVVPLVDALDLTLLTSRWSPIVLVVVSIMLIVFHPCGLQWTPTRGDSTTILSVCVGLHVGAWTNYQLGSMSWPSHSPPYTIIWPSYSMIGLGLLRTSLGFCCIIATRAICKSASYATLCALLQLNSKELRNSSHSLNNKAKTIVELGYKYVTYWLLGFNMIYLLPNVFRLLRIERPTFYTEI